MKDVSKDYLTVNRMCRDIKWLSYNLDYKDIDLKKALTVLEELKEKLKKQLEDK